MAASTLKSYNNFVKGIITEAGPLTYPENASIDAENVVLNREGSLQRRLGMDFEDDAALRSVTLLSTDAVTSHPWEDAAGSTAHQLGVVQVGAKLLIFDRVAPSVSGSLLQTIDLSASISGTKPIQTVSGLGLLLVATGESDPFFLEYNTTTGAVGVTQIAINIRDFFGLDDGLAVDNQPASLSTNHDYNLRNQGWPTAKISAYKADTGSVYPSNAQQWFLGRKDDNSFDPQQLKELEFGTSPAPKGHYVIDAFRRSTTRNSASGLTTPVDIEASRPSAVGFAFQRAFWAGMESTTPLPLLTSPNMTGMVFYSRTLRNPRDLNQYHQDADPTSEVDSELIDTDGGYVIIPDSGKIHRLVAKGGSMIVLAEQGIWEIAGDDGGFRATSHQVRKISDFGSLAPSATVDTEDQILYWNRGGIYLLGANQQGLFASQNVTENNIQTLYNALDLETKRNAVGSFDPVNRKVSWMYNDDLGYTGASFRNRYNKELVLDMALQAFVKNSISAIGEPSPYIAGYMNMPDFLLRKEGVRNRGDSVTKYLVVQFIDPLTHAASVSFSYYRDEALRDWRSSDSVGVSFNSYFITGEEIMGDTTRDKQAPYLFVHSKQTEKFAISDGAGGVTADNPSGLLLQARWGWSNSANSGKWQEDIQTYRLLRPYILQLGEAIDYGQDVVTTKNRIRGAGKSLSLYFHSDGDKDFYLYGWATQFSGKTNV